MRNPSVESSHTRGSSTSASWENVANTHILDEFWVEVDRRVNGLEDSGKHLLWMGIFESTFTSLRSDKRSVLWLFGFGNGSGASNLCNSGSESRNDDDVVVVLSKDGRFSAHDWGVGGSWGCGSKGWRRLGSSSVICRK